MPNEYSGAWMHHRRAPCPTAESYRSTVRLYLTPNLGAIQLAKLQPDDIGRMVASLTARGDLSPTTIRYAYTVLRIALGAALRSNSGRPQRRTRGPSAAGRDRRADATDP